MGIFVFYFDFILGFSKLKISEYILVMVSVYLYLVSFRRGLCSCCFHFNIISLRTYEEVTSHDKKS